MQKAWLDEKCQWMPLPDWWKHILLPMYIWYHIWYCKENGVTLQGSQTRQQLGPMHKVDTVLFLSSGIPVTVRMLPFKYLAARQKWFAISYFQDVSFPHLACSSQCPRSLHPSNRSQTVRCLASQLSVCRVIVNHGLYLYSFPALCIPHLPKSCIWNASFLELCSDM